MVILAILQNKVRFPLDLDVITETFPKDLPFEFYHTIFEFLAWKKSGKFLGFYKVRFPLDLTVITETFPKDLPFEFYHSIFEFLAWKKSGKFLGFFTPGVGNVKYPLKIQTIYVRT